MQPRPLAAAAAPYHPPRSQRRPGRSAGSGSVRGGAHTRRRRGVGKASAWILRGDGGRNRGQDHNMIEEAKGDRQGVTTEWERRKGQRQGQRITVRLQRESMRGRGEADLVCQQTPPPTAREWRVWRSGGVWEPTLVCAGVCLPGTPPPPPPLQRLQHSQAPSSSHHSGAQGSPPAAAKCLRASAPHATNSHLDWGRDTITHTSSNQGRDLRREVCPICACVRQFNTKGKG